jgi:hypothetical protein
MFFERLKGGAVATAKVTSDRSCARQDEEDHQNRESYRSERGVGLSVASQGSGFAVPLQRVVAVVLNLANGREQTGTGYLVDGRQVLTALHCTRDRATGHRHDRFE